MGRPQEGAGQEGLGTSIQVLLALLYNNYGLVTFPDSTRLQGAFNALAGLFGQVGLWANDGKTVSISYQPCHTPNAWST